jgi:DNA-binding transcriptional regulator YiaG
MKILCILEKMGQKNATLELLKNQINITSIDFVVVENHVLHLNDKYMLLRKRDNQYFYQRQNMKLEKLQLSNFEIKEDTYLVQTIQEKPINKTYDIIYCVADSDELGILTIAKYLEAQNIKDATYITTSLFYDVAKKDNKIESFTSIYNKIKNKIILDNFKAPYPRVNDIMKLREQTGMTRTDFSKYFNIPYRTIENWEFDINQCPDYLYELIKFKLISDNKIVDKK